MTPLTYVQGDPLTYVQGDPLTYEYMRPPQLYTQVIPSPMVLYIGLYLKKKKNRNAHALHAACLKSAADGPGVGRYTDFSGARRRLQKFVWRLRRENFRQF